MDKKDRHFDQQFDINFLVELFEEEDSEAAWLEQEHGIFMINYSNFYRSYLFSEGRTYENLFKTCLN